MPGPFQGLKESNPREEKPKVGRFVRPKWKPTAMSLVATEEKGGTLEREREKNEGNPTDPKSNGLLIENGKPENARQGSHRWRKAHSKHQEIEEAPTRPQPHSPGPTNVNRESLHVLGAYVLHGIEADPPHACRSGGLPFGFLDPLP